MIFEKVGNHALSILGIITCTVLLFIFLWVVTLGLYSSYQGLVNNIWPETYSSIPKGKSEMIRYCWLVPEYGVLSHIPQWITKCKTFYSADEILKDCEKTQRLYYEALH